MNELIVAFSGSVRVTVDRVLEAALEKDLLLTAAGSPEAVLVKDLLLDAAGFPEAALVKDLLLDAAPAEVICAI